MEEDKKICGLTNLHTDNIIERTVIGWTEACLSFSSLFTLFLCIFLCPVPDEPPVILTVKPTTTTSVLVQWKVFLDF